MEFKLFTRGHLNHRNKQQQRGNGTVIQLVAVTDQELLTNQFGVGQTSFEVL